MTQSSTEMCQAFIVMLCVAHFVPLPASATSIDHAAADEFLQRTREKLFDGSLVRQRIARSSIIGSNERSMTSRNSFDLDWVWPSYLSYRNRSVGSRRRCAHVLFTPQLMHVVNADESAYVSLPHEGLPDMMSGDGLDTLQRLFGNTFSGTILFARIVSGELAVDWPQQLVQYAVTETEREAIRLHLLRLKIPGKDVSPSNQRPDLDILVSMWLEEDSTDGRIIPVALQYYIHPEVSSGMAGGYRVGTTHQTFVWHRVSIDDEHADDVFTFLPPPGAIEAASIEQMLGLPVKKQAEGVAENLVDHAAPAFELPNLQGERIAIPLAEDDGPIVILDFWATWCVPCIQAMPELIGLAEDFGEQDVRLFAVNVGESADVARSFLAEKGWELDVLLDEDNDTALLYRVKGIPHTVVLDRNGIVRYVHTGFEERLREELGDVISGLLSE